MSDLRPAGSAVSLSSTVVTETTPGQASAAGSASTASRGDHTHGTPAAGSVSTGAPAFVLGTSNADGVAATVVRTDASVAVFDATNPAASAVGDAAAVGSAAFAARRDHRHAREAFATPAIVLGSAAAAGAATSPIRSDSTIAAFDATVPTTSAEGDAAAVGSAAFAARRDHLHGREAFGSAPGATVIGTTAGAGGAATTPARSDHAHGVTAFAIARGGTLLDPTAARTVPVWRAPFACTVTNVRGYRVGGTGATINAVRRTTAPVNSDLLASNLSLTSADTWTDGGAVQNTAFAAGDALLISARSITGTPTEVAIQVDFTRP